MNIFQKYYDNGSITNLDDLNRVYRLLAKKLHPDITGIDSSNKKFIKLKEDYDIFVDLLKKHKIVISKRINNLYSKKDAIGILSDLKNSGFFKNDKKPRCTKLYSERIAMLNSIGKYLNIKDFTNIDNIKNDLNEIKKVDNLYFWNVNFLIESILNYLYSPTIVIRSSVEKMYNEIILKRKNRKLKELDIFIDWLKEEFDIMSIMEK